MRHIAYVNGRYLPHRRASVSIDDRGYQFADGVYEYLAFFNRTPLDETAHLARLQRSLQALHIPLPLPLPKLKKAMRELIARNGRKHGGLYMQVTRGVAKRDHPFPGKGRPTLVMTVCAPKLPKEEEIAGGVAVITHPEQRWQRRDIKAIALLPNVLAKQEAARRGAREAWLVENGAVTEGAVSNAYIVTREGQIVTHPADWHILGGVTRANVLALARAEGITVFERPFTLDEVRKAAEAFMTSTSANVLAVVSLDGRKIGGGRPGKVTRRLQALYAEHIRKQTGWRWKL